MKKNLFKNILLVTSFFALNQSTYATSESIDCSKGRPNASITPASKLLEIELSIFEHLEKEFSFGQCICEEINVNGVLHHLSPVPGDNDCGLHAINAQYPHLNLTREVVLKRFSDIINDPLSPFFQVVTTELASSLVSELRKAAFDNIENTVLPKKNVFFQDCTKDLFSDRNPFVCKAAKDSSVLNAYIAFLKNINVMLLDLSETIDLDRGNEYMGTFGLVCQLYNCNIDLVNFSKTGDMPLYSFHFNPHEKEVKKVLFRSAHFSPLCEMTNEKERRRLAQHHIENVLIPHASIYKNTSTKPISEGHLYADAHTIDAQMAQAITESLQIASTQPLRSSPSSSFSPPALEVAIENVLIPHASIYKNTSTKPIPEGHLYADAHTIDAQMAQAIMESLQSASAQPLRSSPSSSFSPPALEVASVLMNDTNATSTSRDSAELTLMTSLPGDDQVRNDLQAKIKFWTSQSPSPLRDLHLRTWTDLLGKM